MAKCNANLAAEFIILQDLLPYPLIVIVKFSKQGNGLDVMIWTPVSKLRELLAQIQSVLLDSQLCYGGENFICIKFSLQDSFKRMHTFVSELVILDSP